MTPSRLVRVVVAFLLLLAIPSFASAATTQFRVLFDYKPDGCEVNGIDGIDLVLVTRVEDGSGTASVTQTHREVCTGTALGGATGVVTQNAGGATFNNTNKLLTLETRIPFDAFGPALPAQITAYFDASRNSSVHTSVANQDGTPIIIPQPPTRRRSIGFGPDRHITMDGALLDWGNVKPAVVGLASNGTSTLRLLRILAWPDPDVDNHLYFAATAYLNSDFPYADDNTYLRQPDQSLVIGAPGVLDNDAVPGGGALKAEKVREATRGTVTLNDDGSFTYSPTHPQLLTDDEFEYRAVATASGKESNVARVVISVNTGENPNGPKPDFYTTREDKMLVVAAPGVLANDDPTPNVLVASLVSQPANGNVTLNADGGFTYKPKKNFFGTDTFVYAAAKKQGADHGIGGEAIVTITVESVNDAPTFTPGPSPVTTVINGGPFSAVWATNISEGANNESGQSVNFIVSNNNTGLFTVQPQISPNGVLTFTPGGTPGTATVSVQLHDSGQTERGGVDTSPVVTLIINVTCGSTITVSNPANANGTAASPFSETFTQAGGVGATTFSLNSGTLPAGLTLAANGVLSGTPTETGSFPITVAVTDSQGCIGVGPTYPLNIGCQTITVNNPANGNGTAGSAFSETFTQIGGIGAVTFSINSGTLPAGLTLAANGVLSGTPTQTGSFPITVTATDSNGCSGTGTTYTITIGCQTITVNNPANNNGTVSAPFSETFTQVGAIGTPVFTLASGVLPAGLTLAANGTVSGTPTEDGSFPITVTVTDANLCTGTSATYTIIIGCQTITVTNPVNTGGTVSAGFSETFTQSGALLPVTFTLNSGVLPAGLTLATNGTLSGTPTEDGSFPITVLGTDVNGCTGVSPTYNLNIACQTITVTNPANATGAAGSPFSETFTQIGAVGGATFTLASGTLPTGLTLSAAGVLSGTPTQGGPFPITVLVTDGNGCTGVSATYPLNITCPSITVTNPANNTGTSGVAFSETFTQTGGIGTITWSVIGTLPSGITINPASGVLSGTTNDAGSFPVTVRATDQNGCFDDSAYTLTINCQTITVTNPGVNTGTVDAAFSETFTQTGVLGTVTWSIASGTLPAGVTLNPANGVLSGTPTEDGVFPVTVRATDSNGCFDDSAYTLTINCQTITVTNPGVNTGTVDAPFSVMFTETGAHATATFTTASVLPAGLVLQTNGTLSGTPTEDGVFNIVVVVTDANGCTGTGPTYTLTINCQTITVTNPGVNTGTVGTPFSQTFTQAGAHATATFTTASTLPTGLTLSAAGVLSGTPSQFGTFPIVVTVTDANGCTGTGTTYTLTISCQTITVTNPVNTGGTVSAGFSETFTESGALSGATFTLNTGVLPAGLTLATNGTLSGTPTEIGSFPITVLVTDGNGCTGVSATYNLNIGCQTITVTNPVNDTGPAGSPFSETFTQTDGILPVTFTTASTLPTGLSLSTAGVLSGTPTEGGTFPIVVTVTDANGCTGTSATYNLEITCPTITVTNPANGNGTANAAFSETFTQTGGIGTTTFSLASGTLPTGLSLAANGVLSGIPTQTGSFQITVTATDSNGCTGTGTTYTINIACQTITVNNPANSNGTANVAFSETFTQTGGIGATTFSLASGTLPAGLSLAANGVLSGIPTQTGMFPITVTATDSNNCTGTSTTYTINIACQIITVNNPANSNGTANAPFSETFTATNTIGATTFSLASGTLPTGLSLAANGVLSGIPTQTGSFQITVTATDSNGCTGTGTTYTINIACQTITVTNPVNDDGTVNAAFSEQFTQTGAIGSATFTTASTLPTGITLSPAGLLAGTPTQSGVFPIVVTVTDANGCTGTSATYNLNIACQTITVNNPGVTTGTAGTPFSQTFTQTGAVGSVTFTTSSTLPAGLVLQTDGTLTGTPTGIGTFPIVVTVTDANGCTGTGATYNLIIGCQTITVTNPATTSVQAGTTLGAAYTFTAAGILNTANWTLESGTLPVGITLNATTGQLEGSSTAQGSYPITVRVTDTNTCFDISDTYTLDVVCPVITVARTGGGTFPAGVYNAAYTGQSFTGSGGTGPYTFAVTGGTFPTGLSLASDGTISGTPTQTGTFVFTVTATDASLCPGSQSFSIAINPSAGADSYSNLVNNTQAVVTGGATTSPTTPFVPIPIAGVLIANDQPSGGVAIVAGTFPTTQGGSVTIAVDGTFIYTPPVTASPLASDTFTYTIASNTGATGTPTQATGTATLNLVGRVWYVRNNAAAGDGRSHSPFNSTSNFVNGARSGPDTPGDIIFVHRGDGTTTNLTSGVVLLDNEHLLGEGVALVVNTHTLVPAGLQPQLTNSTPGDVIVLGNGNTVRGLTTTGGTNGISGASKTAFTGGNLTLQNATSSGIVLNTFAGAVTLTNTTITNNGIGVNLAAGTLTFTLDNSNSITANAGQRSINFNALGATAVAAIGATITDNGTGINVTNSVAGAQVSFTGTQTLSTGGNAAVFMNANTGATLIFSGVLGVTTTTGSGFTATGGGTLEVGAGASTANITTGATGTASVNITGMTIGAGGVTFDTLNATSPTTGINVVNNNGTVAVNGGTINNAGNGAHLQGATTSLSLVGVTIGGTTTTGINTTTNFGTLTVTNTVNVSATTALNLTGGTVNGTFGNVSSTGGTNGVSLTTIAGTFGTTSGTLTGATGATFNVNGGTAQITWGGNITQSNGANVVTIANKNSGLVDVNGNVTSSGTSTGLTISGGTGGTYTFDGTNAFSGATGITIGPSQAGTIAFSAATTNTVTGTAFNVSGGGGAVTAAITYLGTINKTGASGAGVLIAVDNLDTPGTLNMTRGTQAAGDLTQNNNGANGISVINSSSTNITISNASVTFNNAAAGFTASGNTGGTINLPGLALTGNGNKAGMLISGAGTINVNAGAANPSINLSGGTNAASRAIDGTTTSFTGTLNLTNVTITGNANADIVSLTGSTLGGSGSTISGANRALVLSGVALTNGAGLTSVTSSGGANGISLTNVTGGPYTISGGSLTANTGASFLVSGGTRTITYAGTITQSTAAQRAVDIQTSTGGTINFTGAITSTGAGIFANNNGGTTMSYRGGISLTTTTNAGFTATAGGTVEVCDENPCNAAATGALVNTITTTTGTSLNVANTTISANNLELRSISTNGAANGIVLNTTLALGRLRVNGNVAAASGGTIQATTGDAISLTSTQSPSFNLMSITNTGGQGLNATSLTAGLTVTNSTFSQTGNGDNEHAMRLFDVSGTVSIQNTTFNNTAEDFINIDSNTNNSQMTLDVGTTTACSFTQPNTLAGIRAAGAFAGNGILLAQRNSKNYTINLSNSTFTDIKLTGIQVGSSASTSTASNVNVNLDNNDFLVTIVNSLGNPNNRSNHINIQALNTLDIDASITNNLLDNGGGGGIQLGADNSANLHANITGNTVSDQFADGILIGVDENASLTVLIDGNILSNTSSDGMELSNGISPGGISTLNATITNNSVTGHNNNAGANAFVGGIAVFGAVEAADQTNIDIRSNNVSGNPNPGVYFDYYTQGFGDTILVEGPGAVAVTEPAFLTPGTLANVSGSAPAGRTFLADVFFNNNTAVPLPVLTP